MINRLKLVEFADVGEEITGMRLLHHLCIHERENSEIYEEILQRFEIDPNAQTIKGVSALHLAASHNNYKSIEILFKYGANINLVDCLGETPLIKSAKHSQLHSLVKLLNLNADVNVISKDRSTALLESIRNIDGSNGGDSNRDASICVVILLQFGSVYSPSLSISKNELALIENQVKSLLNDPTSSFARTNYTTSKSLLSWLRP